MAEKSCYECKRPMGMIFHNCVMAIGDDLEELNKRHNSKLKNLDENIDALEILRDALQQILSSKDQDLI